MSISGHSVCDKIIYLEMVKLMIKDMPLLMQKKILIFIGYLKLLLLVIGIKKICIILTN